MYIQDTCVLFHSVSLFKKKKKKWRRMRPMYTPPKESLILFKASLRPINRSGNKICSLAQP